MTLEARKYKLISQITSLKDEAEIARLEVVFKNLTAGDELLRKLAKPMRKHLKVEELVKEQGFKGVDRKKFDALIAAIDVQEPIEELLAAI
ncbi:MAG: hypothetical protein IT258_09015 [Saprospiraceae bacterium]|jgi:hypothetical protein|nr:hypothetical protein [Saprospiraceae bacterium]